MTEAAKILPTLEKEDLRILMAIEIGMKRSEYVKLNDIKFYARYPMEPIRSYGKLFPEERFDSPYTMCLLGTQIDNPAQTGCGRFAVQIDL